MSRNVWSPISACSRQFGQSCSIKWHLLQGQVTSWLILLLEWSLMLKESWERRSRMAVTSEVCVCGMLEWTVPLQCEMFDRTALIRTDRSCFKRTNQRTDMDFSCYVGVRFMAVYACFAVWCSCVLSVLLLCQALTKVVWRLLRFSAKCLRPCERKHVWIPSVLWPCSWLGRGSVGV